MKPRIVAGDLLDQQADAIVNAWNRNIIPWWLLIPQGVSGAIKKKAGLAPFRELARAGPMPLGTAAATGAGKLPYKKIIHVAGINMLWRASEKSIADSTRNAIQLAENLGLRSLAFPIIGAGSGGFNDAKAEAVMMRALEEIESSLEVILVRYGPGR
jgi:O-acetyl-ADP-ribose deacetylase (regulator of RNase III)